MHKYRGIFCGILVVVSVAMAGGGGKSAKEGAGSQGNEKAASRPASPDEVSSGVRSWLQTAIDVSKELAGKDEEPDTKALKRAAAKMAHVEDFILDSPEEIKRFPRESHVAKYIEVRPWEWYYAPMYIREKSSFDP